MFGGLPASFDCFTCSNNGARFFLANKIHFDLYEVMGIHGDTRHRPSKIELASTRGLGPSLRLQPRIQRTSVARRASMIRPFKELPSTQPLTFVHFDVSLLAIGRIIFCCCLNFVAL